MKNLFVGNMSFQTTESDLRGLFEPFGQITRVHVVMDRETGRPRGFAFVEVADDNGASEAITALNGKEVGGRALRVNEAVPKSERRGPSGGFGPPRGNSGRERFSNEDYRESARQPREPRW
ncbi:MAG: RNA-binding protein [Acidobacteria bacterium]|nr:MAG: RNA-binding protein [Acidobacteriota bacterium]